MIVSLSFVCSADLQRQLLITVYVHKLCLNFLYTLLMLFTLLSEVAFVSFCKEQAVKRLDLRVAEIS